jgi:phosphoserine aminotransferase
MTRKYNFCAGPAALPEPVLEQARDELLDWHGSGMSVMEMSHRSEEIVQIAQNAEQDLRDLLDIPSNYKVIFVQGGATTQFAAVPLNLTGGNTCADYINTGQWSKKAIAEARHFCNVTVAASSEESNFSTVPAQEDWKLSPDAAYLHYTPNETIGGLEFSFIPDVDVPLVADMSSTILSRPLDITRFGAIYAGAQKNIGPAGLTLVIVREDLLHQQQDKVPSMLSWKVAVENDSMFNTPPTYSLYLAGLVFQWLKSQGGLEKIAEVNRRKSERLYGYIDESSFYSNPVEKISRSWVNVPFVLADSSLEGGFLSGAEERGLMNLKGHRSVGGMRASIYNAVPEAAVDALIDYMQEFAQNHSAG